MKLLRGELRTTFDVDREQECNKKHFRIYAICRLAIFKELM